jgi:hypothetical protein
MNTPRTPARRGTRLGAGVAKAAVVLEIILGIGAMGGGLVLMIAPRGEIMPLPMSALSGSPFDTYLVPGVILFAVLGVGPLVAARLAWLRHPLAPTAAIVVGAALLIWVAVEVAIIGYSNEPPLQAFYAVLGVVIVLVAARWVVVAGGLEPWEQLLRGDTDAWGAPGPPTSALLARPDDRGPSATRPVKRAPHGPSRKPAASTRCNVHNQASQLSRQHQMNGRLKIVGAMLAIIGLGFIAGGGYTAYRTNQGAEALQAFSAAQGVTLSYNDDGQLVDRGETTGAQAIMSLLVNDWGYAVNSGELNPNDPLVNTASEYMYQMATIAYHTLHGTTTVVLDEPVTTDDGTVYAAGSYEFSTDGRYWTGFDRTNPIEAAAREQVWTGTAHALIAELGVGSVTASTLQIGLGVAALMAGLGAAFLLTGLGLVWATRAATERVKVPALQRAIA